MSDNIVVFKVGDRVSFGGMLGTVTVLDILEDIYPVNIVFDTGYGESFTKDGRSHVGQTEPVLKLISRPKRKVTKTVERWMNIYPKEVTAGCYTSLEDAISYAHSDRITTIKVTGTYEIEVDDVD